MKFSVNTKKVEKGIRTTVALSDPPFHKVGVIDSVTGEEYFMLHMLIRKYIDWRIEIDGCIDFRLGGNMEPEKTSSEQEVEGSER